MWDSEFWLESTPCPLNCRTDSNHGTTRKFWCFVILFVFSIYSVFFFLHHTWPPTCYQRNQVSAPPCPCLMCIISLLTFFPTHPYLNILSVDVQKEWFLDFLNRKLSILSFLLPYPPFPYPLLPVSFHIYTLWDSNARSPLFLTIEDYLSSTLNLTSFLPTIASFIPTSSIFTSPFISQLMFPDGLWKALFLDPRLTGNSFTF